MLIQHGLHPFYCFHHIATSELLPQNCCKCLPKVLQMLFSNVLTPCYPHITLINNGALPYSFPYPLSYLNLACQKYCFCPPLKKPKPFP